MYLLTLMSTETSNVSAALHLVILGCGLGMAFPIFNLTVQNAVPHRELGVATAAIQLFRQMGGTVGVSIMGTILSTRMESRLTDGVTKDPDLAANPEIAEKWKALKDPQILLSPEQLAAIKSQIPPEMSGLFERFIDFLREAMNYVWSYPVSTVIVGCDSIAMLEENVQLAREFTPISDKQMAALHDRTKPVAKESLWFRRDA